MIFGVLSWLGLIPTFQKTKCKRLLSTTMERIKLLRSRREAQLRQLRIDVAKLLQLGKEQKAQVWIGRICKELCLLSVYRKISAYCESVQVNLKDIAGQNECPTNLEEPVAGLCFAASCCADLPELQELREMFAMKYGKKFVMSAQDLQPDCHVNREFLECLCAKDPPDQLKQELLEEIIAQYKLKQGNEQALRQHEQDIQLILDAHDCDSCGIKQEEVDPTALVAEARNEKGNKQDTGPMQAPAVVPTVHEEDLGSTEVAQELANRKKASGAKQSRRSAFKRACNKKRQAWLNNNGEEGNGAGDESNVTANASHVEGMTTLKRHHEAPNQHVVLYVKQPSFSLPPQRPPPPPPPNRAASPSPLSPPNRVPPAPPLRTNSFPNLCHMQLAADYTEAPLPFRSSTMAKKQYNESYDWTHVHPRLPKYEDLVANFTALKH